MIFYEGIYKFSLLRLQSEFLNPCSCLLFNLFLNNHQHKNVKTHLAYLKLQLSQVVLEKDILFQIEIPLCQICQYCQYYVSCKNLSYFVSRMCLEIVLILKSKLFKFNLKQECIPVGCIPPPHWPYLIVSGRGCTCLGVYLPVGVLPAQGVPAQVLHLLLWTEFLRHTTENITLPQLRCRQ